MRDASGDVSDLVDVFNESTRSLLNESTSSMLLENQTTTWKSYGTNFSCLPEQCAYGSQNSFQVSITIKLLSNIPQVTIMPVCEKNLSCMHPS